MAKEKNPLRIPLNYIIITEVAENKISQAIPELARSFTLEPQVAQEVLKSAPVVFLSGIKENELKSLKPLLKKLSKLGLNITIKNKLTNKIPRVVWPTKPQPGGKIIRKVDFERMPNVFVCPKCKETFVLPFAPKGKEAVEPGPVQEGVPVLDDAPVAELTPVKEEGEEEVEEIPEPEAAPAESTQLTETVTEGEVTELTPIGAEEGAPEEPPTEEKVTAETGEVMELKPVEVEEESESAEPGAAEPIDILQPGAKEPEPQPPPTEPAPAPLEPTPAPELEEKPMAPATNCSLFLSRIATNEKKETAAKLIAEIKNIPIEKAREMTKRVLIPVLKDVTEAEAEKAFERFKESGITGRVTKRFI